MRAHILAKCCCPNNGRMKREERVPWCMPVHLHVDRRIKIKQRVISDRRRQMHPCCGGKLNARAKKSGRGLSGIKAAYNMNNIPARVIYVYPIKARRTAADMRYIIMLTTQRVRANLFLLCCFGYSQRRVGSALRACNKNHPCVSYGFIFDENPPHYANLCKLLEQGRQLILCLLRLPSLLCQSS
jgi:hypothetical protein